MKIRRIKLENLKNTRDLGGIFNKHGKIIKKNMLIRSGQLSVASDNDIDILYNNHNLRTVIDLRIDAEISEKPDKLAEGIKYVKIPLLDKSFLGIARDEYSVRAWFNVFDDKTKNPVEVFSEMYDALVFGERTRTLIPEIFDILSSDDDSAVLWHCSAGKDRVGIVTLLVLLALEVERDIIIKDYLATRIFSAKDIILTRLFSIFVLKNVRLVKCLNILMGVKRVYIEKVFERIDNEFDGIEDFFEKQYGIMPETLLKMRKKYLV